jgi:VIT1/CCC1 family predicted Fe2+/Mn2+ transporter
MAVTRHFGNHFTAPSFVQDVFRGISDGIMIPFALTVGIALAGAGTGIILTAGMVEIAAAAIVIGFGGYLAARTDVEHYRTERVREYLEIKSTPEQEKNDVVAILEKYGLRESEAHLIAESLSLDRMRWVDFMMRFELGMDMPEPSRVMKSAYTVAVSYICGGLIPLIPYLIFQNMHTALSVSISISAVALFMFGMMEGYITGTRPWRCGLEAVFSGALAALAAILLGRAIGF